jgi:hypothetical protein
LAASLPTIISAAPAQSHGSLSDSALDVAASNMPANAPNTILDKEIPFGVAPARPRASVTISEIFHFRCGIGLRLFSSCLEGATDSPCIRKIKTIML